MGWIIRPGRRCEACRARALLGALVRAGGELVVYCRTCAGDEITAPGWERRAAA